MKQNLSKLYNSKAFWVIVSLILSIMLWVYVASVETEEFKQTFRGVRVQLVGEALLRELRSVIPDAAMIGYAAEKEEKAIVVEG